MFGEDGWCHSCGVPQREQSGALVLQQRGLKSAVGAWVPNWRFDAFCVDGELASQVRERFRVQVLEIEWHGAAVGPAYQLVVPTTSPDWFDHEALAAAARARHGDTGRACPACGTWRWYPVPAQELPPARQSAAWADHDAVASPEWFGDGLKAFRVVRFTRGLAELLQQASPRDFAPLVG
jgi:hypothetical protein